MSVLGRHGTVKAEGSPEPLDSKWTASGRGKSPVTFVPHVRESTPPHWKVASFIYRTSSCAAPFGDGLDVYVHSSFELGKDDFS